MEELADVMYEIPQQYGLAFDVVHYILCITAARADMGDEFEKISSQNPLVS
jgi:hypothetical protein